MAVEGKFKVRVVEIEHIPLAYTLSTISDSESWIFRLNAVPCPWGHGSVTCTDGSLGHAALSGPQIIDQAPKRS